MERRQPRPPVTALLVLAFVMVLAACGGPPPAPPGTIAATATPTATAARAGATVTTTRTAPTAARAETTTASPSPARGATAARSPTASPTRAGGGATPRASAYPLTIRDIAGRTVTLPRRPERVVSLAPSNTETLYALGLGERVVGVDQNSDFPEAARAKPKVGTFSAPSIEQVVALAPDLVLAANIHLRAVVPALEGRGLTVVVLNPPDLPGVLDAIGLVGQLADANAEAARLRAALEARIGAVSDRLRGVAARPRVYVEITPKFVTAGPRSFIDDLIGRAGGANIAADAATQFPTLSAETIIARDPEVIVLTDAGPEVTVESVGSRPGWAGISAVRAGRVVAIDPDLVNRPGPRVVDALEQLARVLHPEAFR